MKKIHRYEKPSTCTEWFPEDVKPVRHGVYELRSFIIGGRLFSYWNGRRWGLVRSQLRDDRTKLGDAVNRAYAERGIAAGDGYKAEWRGLKIDPQKDEREFIAAA